MDKVSVSHRVDERLTIRGGYNREKKKHQSIATPEKPQQEVPDNIYKEDRAAHNILCSDLIFKLHNDSAVYILLGNTSAYHRALAM